MGPCRRTALAVLSPHVREPWETSRRQSSRLGWVTKGQLSWGGGRQDIAFYLLRQWGKGDQLISAGTEIRATQNLHRGGAIGNSR